jgi:hypothetical protein
MTIFIEKWITLLEAGSGDARKGSFVSLDTSKGVSLVKEDAMSDHVAKYWQKRSDFLLGMLVAATELTEAEINQMW